MSEPPSSQPPEDQDRLEEGLRRLRELGYLQTRAERYVARRVPAGAPTWKVASSVGVWVGIPGGLVFAWILVFSTWLARPELARSGSQVAWLVLDMSLALSVLSFLATTMAAGLSLHWLRGAGRSHRHLLTRVAAYTPGLLAGLYLADRVGQHLLVGMATRQWLSAALVLMVVCGSLASAMTWLQSAMFATARLQWRGVWDPPRVGWQQRTVPFLLVSVSAGLLLLFGPYRAADDGLARLDEIEVASAQPGRSILVVAVDGAGPEVLSAYWPAPRELPLSESEQRSAPTVFWNEVATGFDPEAEGLSGAAEIGARGLVSSLPDGREDPLLAVVLRRLLPGVGLAELRATDRRELRRPQLWEIAAHAGQRSMAINWWATYPAAHHPRLEIISDRYFLRADSSAVDETIAYPFGLTSQLEIEAQGLGLPAPLPNARARDWTIETTGDRRNLSFALAAARDSTRRLIAVLLGGADILERSKDRHAGDRQDYLRELGTSLEELDESGRPVCILLSRSEEGGGRRFWIVSSPGDLVEGVSAPRGLVPQLLIALGLPVGEDMTSVDRAGDAQPKSLPTWGLRPHWSPAASRPSSDLEKLRSLGYIGD